MANQIGLLIAIFCLGFLLLNIWIFEPIIVGFEGEHLELEDIEFYDRYKIRGDPVADDVLISVVFPAYNEEKRMNTTIDSAISFLENWSTAESFLYEILLVDDGSTDATSDIAKSYYERFPHSFRLITLKANQGKGGAMKEGVRFAIGKYILMADADGATTIEDLKTLVEAMKEMEKREQNPEKLGLVVGSRAHLAEKSIASRAFYRTILMKGFHFLVTILCTKNIEDTQCGFKLFTNQAAKILFRNLHLRRWAFDIELIYQAEALGIQMKEISVNWREVEGSKLIQSKADVVITSITMARDMLAVRLAYLFGLWKLPSFDNVSSSTSSHDTEF